MFEALTLEEKRQLAARLHEAGKEFAEEANRLAMAPDSVLAAYDLPRDGSHAFYEAAIESCVLSAQVFHEGYAESGVGWPS